MIKDITAVDLLEAQANLTMTFEERLVETTINQINEVTTNIQWLVDHCDSLNFANFEKLVDRIRLLQITNFYH